MIQAGGARPEKAVCDRSTEGEEVKSGNERGGTAHCARTVSSCEPSRGATIFFLMLTCVTVHSGLKSGIFSVEKLTAERSMRRDIRSIDNSLRIAIYLTW